MCGIVGYVGERDCEQLLVEALEKLEYRGYDSAGITVQRDDHLERVRSVGNLKSLRAAVDGQHERGDLATLTREATSGIGHTRWATHGGVTEDNAHPHSDSSGRIQIVLNGIVENYTELRYRLAARGIALTSETDAEVVAHLVAQYHRGDLANAVRRAREQLRGHFAFVVISADDPGLLVAARKECPLVIGAGEGEHFVASAIPAFADQTLTVQMVEDGDLVAITARGVHFLDASGNEATREATQIDWHEEASDHEGFETYMEKEIHEQPEALRATIGDSLDGKRVKLPGLGLDDEQLAAVGRVVIVACGTSYNAGLIGRYALERWARLPVEFDIASEYRYREPMIGPGDLVIGISQSGETADTLAAMRLARERGAHVVALTNVRGSQATRDCDGVLFTEAGTEIGVAATKTFTAQAAALYLLALKIAEVREARPKAELQVLADQVAALPDLVARTIELVDGRVKQIAERFGDSEFFLFIGRHAGLPVALEGALKLKEISYVPSDAYAAGEMKHGPIALLSQKTPVLCCATDSPVLGKLLSNISEARARGANVIAIATEGSPQVAEHAEEVVYVPRTDDLLMPLLATIPLQLFAHEVARARGLNVDQPRNLAKTVTVE
jgi:glucosamine--fructose-6-phosphate aminotransferase (isomerizing)